MADEEPSAAQKLQIASYFIMSSPAGEIDEVVTDVKKLVNDEEVLSEAALAKVLKDYNVENFISGADPDGNPCIVSPYGQVSDNEFLDPATGRVMRFDHRRRRFVEVVDKKQVLPDNVNKFRVLVEKELADYVASSYKQGKIVAATYGNENGTLNIVISGQNVNLGAYWTGSWRSSYKVNVLQGGSSDLTGDIKLNVHYFEDGNVQLHAKYPSKASVQIGTEAKTASAIAAAVRKIETDFQSNLEQMYINMHEVTFKAMRRFYPINKQPMNWNLSAHKMAGELASGAQ